MGDGKKKKKEFVWKKEHDEFCRQERIYLRHVQKIENVYKSGQIVTIHPDTMVERYATMPVNSFCSIGCHSYAASRLPGDMKIGRYCSIAPNVTIMGTQHPTRRFTSSPLTYASRFREIAAEDYGIDYEQQGFQEHLPPPVIGHDVWIGEHAMLKGGITIGNGAVIAARSVVTKDVAPYSVVGGTPAKEIRKRFSPRHIRRLQKLQWWDYDFFDLPPKQYWEDIGRFCDMLEKSVTEGRVTPAGIKSFDLYAIFPVL